jgi:hypothetical protein
MPASKLALFPDIKDLASVSVLPWEAQMPPPSATRAVFPDSDSGGANADGVTEE